MPTLDTSCEISADCMASTTGPDCCGTCGRSIYNREYGARLQSYCRHSDTVDRESCPVLACKMEYPAVACHQGQCVSASQRR